MKREVDGTGHIMPHQLNSQRWLLRIENTRDQQKHYWNSVCAYNKIILFLKLWSGIILESSFSPKFILLLSATMIFDTVSHYIFLLHTFLDKLKMETVLCYYEWKMSTLVMCISDICDTEMWWMFLLAKWHTAVPGQCCSYAM